LGIKNIWAGEGKGPPIKEKRSLLSHKTFSPLLGGQELRKGGKGGSRIVRKKDEEEREKKKTRKRRSGDLSSSSEQNAAWRARLPRRI